MLFNKGKEANNMSFLEHLEALRWHLIRSMIAIVAIGIIVFLAKDFVFSTIVFGPVDTNFPTYIWLCWMAEKIHIARLCLQDAPIEIVNLELAGQFMTHITVSVILGLVVAFPYVFWEFWRFIKPALYENEVKSSRGLVFVTSVLFLIGVLFGYYIITPFSVNFLGSYQVAPNVQNTISLSSYITSIAMLSLSAGILFELPMVIYFLSKIGLVTPDMMRIYRKHALVGILFIAAIITPPDVASQVLISLPIYLLYEISINISKRVQKQNERRMNK